MSCSFHDWLREQILERNRRETYPFQALHKTHEQLYCQLETREIEAKKREEATKREITEIQTAKIVIQDDSSETRGAEQIAATTTAAPEEEEENLLLLQNAQLKEMIRELQRENDAYQQRILQEKQSMIEEMNKLTLHLEKLKEEHANLRDSQTKEVGLAAILPQLDGHAANAGLPENKQTVPSEMYQLIEDAHKMDGACTVFDKSAGSTEELLTTVSSQEASIKVWKRNGTETSIFRLNHTIRSGSTHTLPLSKQNGITVCDIYGNTVVSAATNETFCRVWKISPDSPSTSVLSASYPRLVHQIVGHSNIISSARLFQQGHRLVTASTDRTVKLWDITSQTYKPIVTFRVDESTCQASDVVSDSIIVTGHADGGIRVWDSRVPSANAYSPPNEHLTGIHQGSITSLRASPRSSAQILTNGLDHSVRIVDLRNPTQPLCVFRDDELRTSYGYSKAVYSPSGQYICVGSNTSGTLFIWDTLKTGADSLERRLSGFHKAGVCAVDWSHRNCIASLDRKGVLVMWK